MKGDRREPGWASERRIEERALIEKFGAAYERYMRVTPAILPIGRRQE